MPVDNQDLEDLESQFAAVSQMEDVSHTTPASQLGHGMSPPNDPEDVMMDDDGACERTHECLHGVALKRMSGFLLFCRSARAGLQAGGGMSLGQIQQELASRWKAQTPEQQKLWKEEAAKHNAQLVAAEGNTNQPLAFPASRIAKLVKLATDKKVGKDALETISRATEAFVELLGAAAAEQLEQRKATTLSVADVLAAINAGGVRFEFLRDALEAIDLEDALEEIPEDEEDSPEAAQPAAAVPKRPKAKARQKGAKGANSTNNQSITAFFARG